MGITKKRKRAWRLTALALVLALTCGCSWPGLGLDTSESAPAAQEGTDVGERLTAGYAADDIFSLNYESEHSLNPLTTESATNQLLMPLMYETLVVIDENFNVQPNLFTEWTTEDGINWYFTIADGVTFHDGSEFTMTDAYYSIFRAWYSDLYGERFSDIAGLSVNGETQVYIRLSQVNYQFPKLLNIPVIKDGSIEEWAPVGCGPYQLGEDMCLEAFPEHPDYENLPVDKIYLKEYTQAADIISAFEDSLLDLVTNDPLGMDNLGYGSSNETRYYNTTNMHYLGYNMSSRYFSSPYFRYAITFAINRSHIVTNIMNGCATAATLPMSPVCTLYNATYGANYDYDMEKFVTALENAGVEDYDDDELLEYMLTGVPVEIELNFIVNSESAVKVEAAREIAASLESVGITVNLRELGWSDYLTALSEGDFDLYYGEVKLTADFDLSSMLIEDGALNYGGILDSGYETRIQDYRAAGEDTLQQCADLLFDYVAQNAPITPICFEKQQVLTHRNVVTGMTPTQYNIFYRFTEWTIDLSGDEQEDA